MNGAGHRRDRRRRQPWIMAAAVFLACRAACPAATNSPIVFTSAAPGLAAPAPAPIVCWSESLTKPRPIRSHFLRFDLNDTSCEVAVFTGMDPDGKGPAEAELENPVTLLTAHNAIAAVNANAFQSLPDAGGERSTAWSMHMPVDIVGLAVTNGILVSAPHPKHTAFWIDRDGKAHIGRPADATGFRQGISDWSGALVASGNIMPHRDDKLHPRTMLGLDQSGRWLLLVVIDGRQPGYSEGVGLHEAATFMKEHGCFNAICLDGGGSSIMLLADHPGQAPRIVNKPSGSVPRPVPVMLGIRPVAGRQKE